MCYYKGTTQPKTTTKGGNFMQKTTLNVSGMSCAHCEKAVKNALSDLGVKSINASAKTGTVEITFSPETVTLEKIKAELNEIGYAVVG